MYFQETCFGHFGVSPVRVMNGEWHGGRKVERKMMARLFGIGPQEGLKPASKLIYPLSNFGVAWYVNDAHVSLSLAL